jgi:hypothetical protein
LFGSFIAINPRMIFDIAWERFDRNIQKPLFLPKNCTAGELN